ncbi:Hypothetical protein R9X50_00257700 [Acrodontium crateriforme]|uniref:ESCRT-II complex subunit VPS25 n=1 Tax=Acrodontium crateriforme TaxID=150365 RepID=A0AAQ3R6S7_9PEZI|nr:Hypothetical protein R9X50_00257700 [Acrodontium crateriforme]
MSIAAAEASVASPHTPSIQSTSPLTTNTTQSGFAFPTYTSFPPFYTLQPNVTTRAHQLDLWSSLVTTYCAYHRLFRISLSSPPADLFANRSINRSLKPSSIRDVLDHMASPAGGQKIEWLSTTAKGEQKDSCYVLWKSANEWAEEIHAWVDETGQKGTVLTVYELRESDAVSGKDWRDMDEGLLRRVLNVLVKRGKAQIFGQEESAGVKFF